jgi:hypothetical protein
MNDNQEKLLFNSISHICHKLGLNQAHDWDGINNIDDAMLYLKTILESIPYKSISQKLEVKCLD